MINVDNTLQSFEEKSSLSGKFPKREKKKALTRRKIIASSIELFLESSAEDITLEDVAAHAGIHVQTIYRHFPKKISLMLAGDTYWLEKCKFFFDQTKDNGTTFERWRAWLDFSYRGILEDPEKHKRLYMRKTASPIGRAGLSTVQTEYEDLLCRSLALDFNLPEKPIGLPRLVAGMLVSGNAAIIRSFTESEIDFFSETMSMVDKVEDLFAHLIVAPTDQAPKCA